MDYEKAYKEVLEKAKGIINYYKEHNRSDEAAIEDLEEIFPELKESEDEKIRKAIIAHIKSLKYYDSYYDVTPDEMIAWLERQGNKPQGKAALEAIHEDKVDNANKVAPKKFGIGDFIANDYCFGKIIKITNDAYLLDTGQGIPFSYEHNAHLWTISDAKDGNVLCFESGWTCIFKALGNHTNTFSSYCYMDSTGWFCERGSESHTLEDAFIKAYHGNIYPATKEQRDLLFQKMKEAGYEFDFEKKELKKIEQKPADVVRENPNHHEGWVNVYKLNGSHEDLDSFALYQMQQGIFETKYEALKAVKKSIKYSTYIATVKIEWKE